MHILERSSLSANLFFERIPRSDIVSTHSHIEGLASKVLSGGDDYELCFTAPASAHDEIIKIGNTLKIRLSTIGHTVSSDIKSKINLFDENQQLIQIKNAGYDHFA